MLRWLKDKLGSAAAPADAAAPVDAGAGVAASVTPVAPQAPAALGAQALYDRGRVAEAGDAARALIETNADDVEGLRVLALLAIDRGQPLEALRGVDRALAVEPDSLALLVLRGRALAAAGRRQDALAALKRAGELHPRRSEPLVQQAMLDLAARREDDAAALLSRALELEPADPEAAFRFADLLRSRGRDDEALDHYRRSVAARPDHAEALNNFGSLLRGRGRLAEAALHLEAALRLRPDFPEAAWNLGLLRVDQRRWPEACELLRAFVAARPKDADAHYWLGNAAMANGQVFEARKAYQSASRLNAGLLQARWGHAMAQLPAVPQSEAEQDAAPEAFRRELSRMKSWFRANPAAEGQRAVGAQQPFYLAYVPQNHRATLADYGTLCTSLMAAWGRKVGVPKPAPAGGAKLRVGIVSAHLHSHSVWHAVVRGWVEHLDRSKFDLHLFHTGGARDAETEWAARRVTRLTTGLGDWPNWGKAISDARLDVLIFPEIGMDATTTRLASLRLAPVQLASWGHPVTTGLPTIDAYLSAQAFEPAEAATHYTEKLVALPRLGCCYKPFGSQPAAPDLAAWNISPDDRLLLCAGTPFKYAPKDDTLLVEIARRCRPCKLVFFRAQPEPLSLLLETRLRKVFEAAGLPFDDCVRFIPWQSQAAFFGLLDRADACLDSVGFSGFNTTMQALERGTPVVAWEGEFMRGRFASGILRAAGLDDWIADTAEDYVDRVVRLCTEPGLKAELRRRIRAAWPKLIDDRAVVTALGEHLLAMAAARPAS